jgi:hypothetical protein
LSAELVAVLASAGVILATIAVVAVVTRGSTLRDVEMRFSSPLTPPALRDEALNGLLGVMVAEEYALASVEDARLTFVRRHRPAWTIYVALLIPLGLLALLRRKWVRVDVEVTAAGEGSAIVARGTVTRRLQHALRGFFASS